MSLPARELSAGLAEVIKHAILADETYFAWLEENMDDLRGLEPASLAHAIRRSCEIKAGVVARDERETGVRAILNLGHTFGHAIENALGYGQWLHGEAVGAGMVLACDLAVRLGMLSEEDRRRVETLVRRAGLPVNLPREIEAGRLLDLMGLDKKVSDEGMRFVLPSGLGRVEIVERIDRRAILATLERGTTRAVNYP